MIVLKIKTAEKDYMSDIAISALEAEIIKKYEPDDAKKLILKFHSMMLGSTVSMMGAEMAIYPHDVAAIFSILKIPIKFIDETGADVTKNGDGSGVKWHCY